MDSMINVDHESKTVFHPKKKKTYQTVKVRKIIIISQRSYIDHTKITVDDKIGFPWK